MEQNNGKIGFKEIKKRIILSKTREKSKQEYNERLKELEAREGKKIDYKDRQSLRRSIMNRNKRRCSTLLIREMQIKATKR